MRATLDAPQMYTHFAGLPELRAALAQYYADQHDVAVAPDSIIATMGSSAGFILAFLGAFAPGAKIAVTRPGYPAYLNTLSGMGFHPVEIPVTAANGWHLSAADIAAAHAREKFDGLLLASPANPTGAAVTREQLGEIVAICAKLGVRFISDEIYHGLDYRGPSVSALEFDPDAIVINSFSQILLHDRLAHRLDGAARRHLAAHPDPAAKPLHRRPDPEPGRRHRRPSASATMPRRKKPITPKTAASSPRASASSALASRRATAPFTPMPMSAASPTTPCNFCKTLLETAGVAATPGIDFDRTNGHRFVRFSYAGSRETMEKALERMQVFLSSLTASSLSPPGRGSG